jgi:preprotein translocase subunit SecD
MKLTFRIWLLIALFFISILFIFGVPPKIFESGVVVTSVGVNSTLANQGLKQGDVITAINGQSVSNLEDYSKIMAGAFVPGQNAKLVIDSSSGEYTFYGSNLSDLEVAAISPTNIQLGLDLAGGARALVKAQNVTLNQSDLNTLVQITQNRLNTFGLTDMQVSPVSDLSGNNYMLIEIAGATPADLQSLISQQGKFEAKIDNTTVFEGGKRDIASVGRSAQDAVVESCSPGGSGYVCPFYFNIVLSPDAAQRQANITANIPVQGGYLTKKLDLYLDGKLVDSLQISEGLRGRVTTQIQISGSGTGATESSALADAQDQMKKLQTILMTGSLPYKLEIVQLDTLSPLLGQEFISFILLAGLVAILCVSLIVFIRYRRWKSSLALIASTVSEVVIILGIAAFIQWNLDLPSIAGILATIGTGIDDLIVLMDEAGLSVALNLKQKLKRAFSIIMGSYFTVFVSLLPLMWAGAGLLKGFAITTIIGISVGVFITRPAFADLLRISKERSEKNQ